MSRNKLISPINHIMPTHEMIADNQNNELSDNYFYDEFCFKCSFLKINDDINEMNFCKNPVNNENTCTHRNCPFWSVRCK